MARGHIYQTLINQWLGFQWSELSQFTATDLEPWDHRDELALMVAVANLQLKRSNQAHSLIKQAVTWGAGRSKQAAYLVMGTNATLHRIRLEIEELPVNNALQGQFIKLAKRTAFPAPDLEKCHQKGDSSLALQAEKNSPKKRKIELKRLSSVELGEAWAGNTVNTVIFRHHGMFTVDYKQYTAFYLDEHTLRIAKRNLKTNALTTSDLKGDYNLNDAHNIISLGMDREGIIHICYDHHGTKLRYRRSLGRHDISGWTNELPMTGVNEDKITYPTFLEPKGKNPLLLLYRDGAWNKGTAYLKRYDEEEQVWRDYPKPILSGADNKPWTSNAYWNHPAVGKDGLIRLSYVWRTDYFSEEKRVNNMNVGFSQSYDQGHSWYASNEQPYKLPITQVNSECVLPVSPGSNLINQTSMALDSKGHPHIALYSNDGRGVPQYQHLWFNGSEWQIGYVSRREKPFVLSGGGTLKIPISRPEILVDSDDTVFIIFRSEETKQKFVATCLFAPDYRFKNGCVVTLSEESVGQAEPVIDRLRWESEEVLSLYLQYSDQPDHEGVPVKQSANAKIADFTFITGLENTNELS